MTQNVKTWPLFQLAARGSSLLTALSFSLMALSGGCSDSKKPADGSSGSGSMTNGRFDDCKSDDECDQAHGFSCVMGMCSYECTQHSDCVAVGHCEAVTVEGERRQFCVRDEAPPEAGKLYTSCPNGTECTDALLCVGAGPGDLDAYCTVDCSSDDDCGLGYYCGTLTRLACEKTCDADPAPAGTPCVSPDLIGKGKPFYCNALGSLERKVCRQREFCASCDTDADCLAVPNQVCAKDQTGAKICTRLCDTGTRSCPWGNAAECAVFDEELGLPTCAHRFGRCHGDGGTCEPCLTNQDCPNGACTSSSFTGERWCVNFDTTCECKNGVDRSGTCNDGGCPPSPDGLTLQCFVRDPKSTQVGVCYAANSGTDTLLGTSPQTGCWSEP